MTAIRVTLESIREMREMFPKCYYCAASIRETPIRELVNIAGKNRLGHQSCATDLRGIDDAAD